MVAFKKHHENSRTKQKHLKESKRVFQRIIEIISKLLSNR